MRESNCVIRIEHEYAQSFFDEAMHPDLDELRRRDAFLAELEETCPVHIEKEDFVVEISEIDIISLLSEPETGGYILVGSAIYQSPLLEVPAPNQYNAIYSNSSMCSIAA